VGAGDLTETISVRARFERFPATVKGAFILRGEDPDPHQVVFHQANVVGIGLGVSRPMPIPGTTLDVIPHRDLFVPFEMPIVDLDPGWYTMICDLEVDGLPNTFDGGRRFSVPWPRATVRRGALKVSRGVKVGDATVHVDRTAASTVRTPDHGRPCLRRARAANSFSTWTLTTPPALRSSPERRALAASVDAKYATTFVSKNASVALIGFEPIELDIGRELVLEAANPLEKFVLARSLLDLNQPGATDVEGDVVTLFQLESLNDSGGQPHGKAVSPLGDLHDNLLDIQKENVYPCAGFVKIRQMQSTLH